MRHDKCNISYELSHADIGAWCIFHCVQIQLAQGLPVFSHEGGRGINNAFGLQRN